MQNVVYNTLDAAEKVTFIIFEIVFTIVTHAI